MEEAQLHIKGLNGQVALFGDRICIMRKGLLSRFTQGLKGDKTILLSSITSVQFKKATYFTNGYIQFGFMGGREAKGGLWQGTQDENTVVFNKKQQPGFEKIKLAVENPLQENHPSTSGSSEAEELMKLAELRDKGILTEDEFVHKKKQILGL